MDSGSMDFSHSWGMRLGEIVIRSVAMALVLTGQMLPSGSVSAEDGPPFPVLVAPESPAVEQPPEPPVAEAIASPEATLVDELPTEAPTPVATTTPTPVIEQPLPAVDQDTPADIEAAVPEIPAAPAPALPPEEETQPLPTTTPAAPPAVIPNPMTETESRYTFGDWTVTVRPGPVAARLAAFIAEPLQSPQFTVPVTVNNYHAPAALPLGWSIPAYASAWENTWGSTPTSAYLFQRPLPYWKLHGDFPHLAPFIPGLRY